MRPELSPDWIRSLVPLPREVVFITPGLRVQIRLRFAAPELCQRVASGELGEVQGLERGSLLVNHVRSEDDAGKIFTSGCRAGMAGGAPMSGWSRIGAIPFTREAACRIHGRW